MRLRRVALLAAMAASVGCSDLNKSKETIFTADSPKCLPNIIKGEYLVSWENGKVTKVFADDLEAFKNGFVTKNLQEIKYIETNKMIYLDPRSKASSRGLVGPGTGFSNWPAQQTLADVAWKQGFRGQDVVVAVIDSGVDYTHPQLHNQLALNEGESGTDGFGSNKAFNGIDDDNNGYVDDYYGYNFGYDSNDPYDSDQHGTHVAGIIAAHHDDNVAGEQKYIQGIAPDAKVLPVAFITAGGGGTLDAAIDAIEYARLRGADIINASWGGASCSKTLGDKIKSLEQDDILFVAASGNNGKNIDLQPEYPAAYNLPVQITVGAVSQLFTMAAFSNYGTTYVHIFAPGKDIYSTVPNSSYEAFSGTSMAAPMVAGALALLKSAKPLATFQDLKKALYSGVTVDNTYRNTHRGRLNIKQSLGHL